MPTTSQDRRSVALGILAAWVLSALFYWISWAVWGQVDRVATGFAAQAVARALLLASLALAAGIGWAARTRHFDAHIDGSAPTAGSMLDLTLRYITNTQEQLLLFAIACVGIGAALPSHAPRLLLIAAVWFLIARVLFVVGYIKNPTARAVGFAGTFHPTLVLIAVALYHTAF